MVDFASLARLPFYWPEELQERWALSPELELAANSDRSARAPGRSTSADGLTDLGVHAFQCVLVRVETVLDRDIVFRMLR